MTTPGPLPGCAARSFDVLMPYYGDVEQMRTAVRSVLGQGGEDWHLTVLDDGYPDPEVAAWFEALLDPRVTYLRNEKNLGANRNYAKAVSLASAPYLVMMGADDLMLPTYLDHARRLVRAHPTVSVFQAGVTVIGGDGEPTAPLADKVKRWTRPRASSAMVLDGERLAASLLRANWTYFPSLCWRTDVVQQLGFRQGLDVAQDLALLLDVAVAGGSLLLSPGTPTFAYRRHADSDSAARAVAGGRFEEEARYFQQVARRCSELGWRRAERAARLHLTSRLHAASLVPAAATAGEGSRALALARHAVGR